MRVSINDIQGMKEKGKKIPMLTAYDYATAKAVDEAGVPLILVGDSLGMVILGYESTTPVTIEEMLHHTRAVVRGSNRALIIGDMPFMTYYHTDLALENAARFIQEGEAQAVKVEGGERVADIVRKIVEWGIPVMGHIGLTPQSILALGGYKVQGKTPDTAKKLLNDARALEEAGVFSIVLEVVPGPLAHLITQRLTVPTIGIGAGSFCDGQVQVISDILGLFPDFVPKHARQYANILEVMKNAIKSYISEVSQGTFPTPSQSFPLDEEILSGL